MLANERITFDEPPIKEVALGRTFLYRPDFLMPYFGLFWTRIKERYPTTQEAGTILDPTEDTPADEAFSPRVLFVAEDARSLVQLQQNRFHYNWRQLDPPSAYVRFPTIKATCLEVWKEFEAFVSEVTGRPLQPLKGELTYTNVIEAANGETAFDIAALALHDSCWASHARFLSQPRGFSHSYAFAIPGSKSGLQAVISAATRKLPKGEKVEALKIELTVKGPCSADESFDDWAEQANVFLVNAFKDLTTPEMHKKWELRGIDGQQ